MFRMNSAMKLSSIRKIDIAVVHESIVIEGTMTHEELEVRFPAQESSPQLDFVHEIFWGWD